MGEEDKDKFDKMAVAITEYMKEKGWSIVVIGKTRVQQQPFARKYNYELVWKISSSKKTQTSIN